MSRDSLDDNVTGSGRASREFLSPGRMVGRYRIIDVIGYGGMGVLYRAHDPTLQRTIALKSPWEHFAAEPQTVARFLREARTTAGLSHPHIVKIHEVFQDDGLPWLAMELVRGQDLRARIADRETIPTREILRWADQVLRALESAHSAGVLHRDIKPANILISDDDNALLTDFGLARQLMPGAPISHTVTAPPSLTYPGAVIGTVAYMSPEQAAGRPLDERSDLYSFGAVLYEMCTGRRMSSEPGCDVASGSTSGLQSRSIRRRNRSVPAGLEAIICKAVSPRPEDRYASATEMLAELQECRREWEAGRVLRRLHRTRPRIVAVATLLLAAIVTTGWFWVREKRSRQGRQQSEIVSSTVVSWPGTERGARISPDKQWVSFVADRDGAARLWFKNRKGGMEQAVTPAGSHVIHHVWSEDGQEIAWTERVAGVIYLKIAPAFGGPARQSHSLGEGQSRLIRWIGSRISFERDLGLHSFDTQSAEVTELIGKPTNGFRGHYDVHPDGEQVVYMAGGPESFSIWTSTLDGRDARRLTGEGHVDSTPLWMPGKDDSVIYASTRSGLKDLWRHYLSDGTDERITFSEAVETPTSVSADGSLVMYERSEEKIHLWMIDPASSKRQAVTAGSASYYAPATATEEPYVTYQRTKPTLEDPASYLGGEIVIARVEGSRVLDEELQVRDGYRPRLSPAGRWVAYHRDMELWWHDSKTGESQRVSETVSAGGLSPFPIDWVQNTVAWSEEALYFVELDVPSRLTRVRRAIPQPGKEPETIVPEEAGSLVMDLAVSPGGDRLAYVRDSTESSELRILDLDSKEFSSLLTVTDRLYLGGWLGDGESVLVVTRPLARSESDDLEILEVGENGQTLRRKAIPGGWVETLAVDGRRRLVYLTVHEDGLDNVVAVSLDDLQTSRLTDNQTPGVTFSEVQTLPGGQLIYTRQERNQDISSIEFQ